MTLDNFEKIANITLAIVQILAIFAGGIWAFKTFGSDKKAEKLAEIKSNLGEFDINFTKIKKTYENQVEFNVGECIQQIIPYHNDLSKKIWPKMPFVKNKELKKRINKLSLLTMNGFGKVRGTYDLNVLKENWKAYEEERYFIYNRLDSLISQTI